MGESRRINGSPPEPHQVPPSPKTAPRLPLKAVAAHGHTTPLVPSFSRHLRAAQAKRSWDKGYSLIPPPPQKKTAVLAAKGMWLRGPGDDRWRIQGRVLQPVRWWQCFSGALWICEGHRPYAPGWLQPWLEG